MHCSAYWYALKGLFVKAATPILELTPAIIKPRLTATQEAIRSLESLAHFIADKRNRESRQFKDCMLYRHIRQGTEKRESWRMRA